MKKLTKAQMKQHAEIVGKFYEYNAKGNELVQEYNDAVALAFCTYVERVEELSNKLLEDMANDLDVGVFEEAADFAADIADRARDFFDARSERWQEGDSGSQYEVWMDQWDAASTTPEDPQDFIETPEPYEPDDVDWEEADFSDFEDAAMTMEEV